MSEVRRCIKEQVVLSPVFDTDIYIGLCYKTVIGIGQIVNARLCKSSVSVMHDNRFFAVILNYPVSHEIDLVVHGVKKIGNGFHRVGSELIVGIKEKYIFSVRSCKTVITGF